MRPFFTLIAVLFLGSVVDAQIGIGLGFNGDRQPVWGPTGHDHVEYYYLPDIEVYYSVPQHRYCYNEDGRWVGKSLLPSRYQGYDLYTSYKVVVNELAPYRHYETYREKYSSYKGRHDQQPICDSRDSKYFVNKNHPEHNNWVKHQRHDNGNGGGNGRDNNHGRR